jgi:3-oxoacyl-[acyl-carrier-protein] synthase II
MSSQPIGICGIGVVSGYGWGRESLWDGLIAGKPAAIQVAGHGPELDQTAWLARVPDCGDLADGPGRFAQAMRAAAREAILDAGQHGWHAGRKVGLVHAVVLTEVDLWRDFYLKQHGNMSVREYLALMPSTSMSTLMQEHGFHGPAMTVSAMCTSGNAGLLTAKAWLDAGVVDDVVFVATDLSATPENVLHFARLGVTITDAEPLDACRPFQEGSRGFIMGEASVAFVLSRRALASYTMLLGGAMTHDAYHVTSIDPNPIQVANCFREALANTRTEPSAVRYLNAHGPGTKQCDTVEAAIADDLFQQRTGIYSMKPFTGHCQGAASAVEIAVTALGYERGVLPIPPKVAPGHARLLDGPTPIAGGITVKSSLGMGGHNSVVVLAPGR